MSNDSHPVIVWRILDGKPGHENQSAGLVQALAELLPVVVHDVAAVTGWRAGLGWLSGRFAPGDQLPAPDLIVGAGHATHVSMLAARRAFGGRIVVLMQPSLPLRLFDLCLVPLHDCPAVAGNVLPTEGVLNRVRPGEKENTGLILVGGPSRHHGWQGDELIDRVCRLVAADTEHHWVLTTSRRTPVNWLAALSDRLGPLQERLTPVPCEQTDADWLPAQLAGASVVWVTADSVSMVYEALTSGACVGVLPVPVKKAGRVTRGLERLLAEGRVVSFDEWSRQGEYAAPQQFNEAQRCARWIRDQWLSAN